MAGTVSGGRGSRGGIVGINVTPMVDVVLVLLVIMMVSATYIVSQSMHVDLPKASNGDPGVASLAQVMIASNGSYNFNDESITEQALIVKLREAHAANEDVTLVVSADQASQHGIVVHVLDLAKAEGITHFAIGVERPE